MKVLANDGISNSGKLKLTESGFEVIDVKVAQEQLANFINEKNIAVLLVRSATQVDKKVLENCSELKLIGRGGVGLDNIDVEFAKSKGIEVINTPNASKRSVAELVFAHLLNGARFLHDSNRVMPLEGDEKFGQIKQAYKGALELKGKTLGIIGFGRIGESVAKLALGFGMQVFFHDHHNEKRTVKVDFADEKFIEFVVKPKPFEELLKTSDFISIHLPAQKDYLIGKKELQLMKSSAGVVNTSRGGLIDEVALVEALDKGTLAFAGLDVFENEPKPAIRVLMHPKISLSPHIGGSTIEAQNRIGLELAEQIIELLK